MGLLDKAKPTSESVAWQSGCPSPGAHYVTEVNKGSLNMGRWQGKLNEMHAAGYRLAHVLEQDGNTVQVFEHRHP